jgi:hypothetical protein
MTIEEMQKQIGSMMPTPKQIVENIDKKLEEKRELIVHNILREYAEDNGLVKYEYHDGFYVFGNPDCQELADKKHEEWLMKYQTRNDDEG